MTERATPQKVRADGIVGMIDCASEGISVQQRNGSWLKGAITISLLTLNVLLWVGPLLVVAALKLAVPLAAWRRWTSRVLTAIAECWISTNDAIFRMLGSMPMTVSGLERLEPSQWYLVVSNHRSWVDILVLQSIFNRRIPFLKFFLKRELIWVPLLGLAWWALDFPFMRRYSSAFLAAHPEQRDKDLAATQRACAHFRAIPTSIMNFVEGTRYSDEKRIAQGSVHRALLTPRAGGVSFVLSAMGGILHAMLDVTIAYRPGTPTLWDLCCGRLGRVIVDVRRRAIENWMSEGDYSNDPAFRERFQAWLTGVWQEKDALLVSMA
jgi:1-acyl-sn-glycerol-3-phosphate acyltransferase